MLDKRHNQHLEMLKEISHTSNANIGQHHNKLTIRPRVTHLL